MRPARLGITFVLLVLAADASKNAAAQPTAGGPPPLINPDLWRDPGLARLIAHGARIGLIQAAPGRARTEAFHVDRAILQIPIGLSVTQALARSKLDPFYQTPNQLPPSVVTVRNPKDRRPAPNPLAPSRFVTVKLPWQLMPAATAEGLARAKFGVGVQFSSAPASQAMGYILEQTSKGVPLIPDFLGLPAQMLTPAGDQEDKAIQPPANDLYWTDMHLWQAWQLRQVAPPAHGRDIWAAIVDQGFASQPTGITWDKISSVDGSVGRASDFEDLPWHGTDCASALTATVNDQIGAAGSALLGGNLNVQTVDDRRVKTIAVEMPAGSDGSWSSIARSTQNAIDAGAQVVSASYAGACSEACQAENGDIEIQKVLQNAKEKSVLVFFAAGNENLNLDSADITYVGCETPGAECVGGIEREDVRWQEWDRKSGSNFGQNVRFWGPAKYVWVNPNPDSGARQIDGTSLATPFVAGIVALAESSWGIALNSDSLAPLLTQANVVTHIDDDPSLSAGVLNAYELMRLKARIGPDEREPNDSIKQAANQAEPSYRDLLTLDKPSDRDLLPVVSTGCEQVTVEVDYLRDTVRGTFQVSLAGDSGPVAGIDRGDLGIMDLNASVCPGRHYLDVHQDRSLTTGYSVTIRHQSDACPSNCAATKSDAPSN